MGWPCGTNERRTVDEESGWKIEGEEEAETEMGVMRQERFLRNGWGVENESDG